MMANSMINTISSFAFLIGPALGGVWYSAYGIKPILWICMFCFLLSAVMELFIHIPFEAQALKGGIWKTVKMDFTESVRFIQKEKPVIGKTLFVISGINLFLSAMIIVALPYLITEVFPFEAAQANRLYGYAQGALAAGGLIGGICAGVFARLLSIQKSGNLIILCAICVFPISAILFGSPSGMLNYLVLTLCCFFIIACSTIFTVQMMSFIQTETPQQMIGKVIAVILTVSMCAQPLGNALYGILFDICKGFESLVVLFSGVVSLIIAISARKIFKELSV